MLDIQETLREVGAAWFILKETPRNRGGVLCYQGKTFFVILRDKSLTKRPRTAFETEMKKTLEAAGIKLHFALDESDVLALIGIEG